MKQFWKVFIFIFLNLLLLLILCFSFMIYASEFKAVPWHTLFNEAMDGFKFHYIIWIFNPFFIIIGIALVYLGRVYRISKLNKFLPFISIIGLSLPLMITVILDTMFLIGTIIGALLCLLVIVSTISTLISQRKETYEKQVFVAYPVGLYILAVFNFLMSIYYLYLFSQPATFFSTRSFVVKGILVLLYILSGIGYLKKSWYLGYLLGNITAIGKILIELIPYHFPPGLGSFFVGLLMDGLFYPILTIVLLNLVYRELFRKSRLVRNQSNLKHKKA